MWETEISITFHLHGMADLQVHARKNKVRSLLMATLLVCSHSEHDATANGCPTTLLHHILTVTLNAANAANETENTRTIQKRIVIGPLPALHVQDTSYGRRKRPPLSTSTTSAVSRCKQRHRYDGWAPSTWLAASRGWHQQEHGAVRSQSHAHQHSTPRRCALASQHDTRVKKAAHACPH